MFCVRGVIGPLLANLCLNRFLKYWRLQEKGEQVRAEIVAYADDFVILSRGHAVEAREWMQAVMDRIGLTLNEQKTSIRDGPTEEFDFLGYTFGPLYWWKTGTRYMAARSSRACNGCEPVPASQNLLRTMTVFAGVFRSYN